jgi:AcrR family transcriptional regulator
VIANARDAIQKERDLLLSGVNKRTIYSRYSNEDDDIRQAADRRLRKLDAFHSQRLERQISLTQNLARLSPTASFLFASVRLAGTGPSLHRYVRQAHQQFRSDREAFFDELRERSIGRDHNSVRTPEGWFQPESLPRLSLFRESVRESLDAALPDVLLLAAYNVLFFMAAYVAFLCYDVT